jgi:ATP-dependent DNA helicase RecG
MTLQELLDLKESEDKVEFKSASKNFKYAGGDNREPKDRRHCVLGYVTAFCNEGGGMLVLGISDGYPHNVIGTDFAKGIEGKLTDQIYNDIQIRVSTEVFWSDDRKRVLIIKVPTRPIGKLIKFESVALMRIGESLREMSDDEMRKILLEQEPDFSATICVGLQIEDLDIDAIDIVKKLYSLKQKNKDFTRLSIRQVLSDLDLLKGNKLTYASLILLGKRAAISKYLPQARTSIEFRSENANIHFDDRRFFDEPFFISINSVWEYINLRNGNFPIQQGPYIFDIPLLNEEVVREAIHNAYAHRDYKKNSEIVVKQFTDRLEIISPGGFPLGVSVENILTVNSTPRNRLLTEVLLKTGVVERSGQGVDKLFKNTILEAKGIPDYYASDIFQVVLKVPTIVKDKAFVLFLEYILRDRKINLSLQEILVLECIRDKSPKHLLDKSTLRGLLNKGLVEPVGKTNVKAYILSKEYYQFTNQPAAYTLDKGPDSTSVWLQLINHFAEFNSAKMSDFEELFKNTLTREQVKYHIYSFANSEMLLKQGKGRGTSYRLSDKAKKNSGIIGRVMELGFEEMKKRGELPAG